MTSHLAVDEVAEQKRKEQDASKTEENSGLSRKEKKRLKKLQKRSHNLQHHCELSGVSSAEDGKELHGLLEKKKKEEEDGTLIMPVPSIHWRTGKVRESTEGADHRDILFRILQAATNRNVSKKRKRDEPAAAVKASVPSWATLHNSALVQHIAVLELHVDEPESLAWLEGTMDKVLRDESTLKAAVRWFQGSKQQKSVTDALMYATPNRQGKPGKAALCRNTQDLVKLLHPLQATAKQLKRECYPIKEKELETARKPSCHNKLTEKTPREIALKNALEFIRGYHVGHSSNVYLPDFVAAPEASSFSPKILALDCEMVQTVTGLELARITLLQVKDCVCKSDGGSISLTTELVFDELVKPRNAVTDYLTPYSGITAAMLSNEEKVVRLEQVQAALLNIVQPNDILIGHSLENDLKAARWIHPTVVDTALLFRPNQCKYSLKHLAAVLLKRKIQRADQSHCSQQDAEAALQLAVHRAVMGPPFADPLTKLTKCNQWLNAVQLATIVCIGPTAWLQRHVTAQPNAVHALQCESIHDRNAQAVTAWLAGPKRRADSVWAQIHLSKGDENAVEDFLVSLLSKISKGTVLLVALQAGLRKADQLAETRHIRQNPKTTMQWSSQEEQEWLDCLDACRNGSAYWVCPK
jgi:DNA polymerase III epsilon subunit-like protein